MAITLIQPPPRIAYSRRDVPMILKTDRVDPSQRASVVFVFSAPGASEGNSFTLRWLGNAVTFIFKAVPDASGVQLPTFDNNRFFDEYLTEVANIMRRHFAIVDDWNVYVQPNTIRLYAKQAVAMDPSVVSTLQNVVITPTISLSTALDVHLSAYTRVIDSTETPFGAPLNVPYNLETGEALFDLQSIFSHLQPHLPVTESLNPLSNFRIEWASRAYMVYKLWCADKSGSPPTPQRLSTFGEYFAVYGTSLEFPIDATQNAVVLHPRPTIRTQVGFHQPDYAYVWSLQDWYFCYIEITIYLSDGTSLVWLPNNGIGFFLGRDSLFLFRTGFEQLGLHRLSFPNGNRIAAYDWRIIHNNALFQTVPEPFTPLATMRYDVDYQAHDTDLYLLVDNGMGGMETLRLRGAVREKYAVEMTDLENADGSRDTFAEEVTMTYEVTTGVMATDMARYYRQLLRGQLWLCDLKKYQFRKVVRVTKDIELNPKVPFNALKFAFSIAQKES